jgi:uncharacterized protein YyaL (SSP411 family)
MSQKVPNTLIHESSPYLLQHAYNPVQWLPFGEAAFKKAKEENKLVLISIGYSACHWCHVMEHESFEKDDVAEVMNRHYVCVKVDREERTDVDMIYMQAVQLMTGHGGWPLNCFTLPDGRPVYGGTYFNKQQWVNILLRLAEIYKNEPEKMLEYAGNLTGGMKEAELISAERETGETDRQLLMDAVKKWKTGLDNELGGPNKAPKFPLPNNYLFLLRHAILENDTPLLEHVELTLQCMANGGIYDQLRGGFARYSVDKEWKVPHFEKMLYDNAQLVSLYCEAFRFTKDPLYEKVVRETLNFMKEEWMGDEGFIYSAYDADSEGEEGKYYVWSKEELRSLLKDDLELFGELYGINEVGYWEHGNYILMRNEKVKEIAFKFSKTEAEAEQIVKKCKDVLLMEAEKRVKPGLDDKSICSWNAMGCSAYCDAYLVFGDEEFRKTAMKSMDFLLGKMLEGGELKRAYKKGQLKIDAMLDDHAFLIQALMKVYLITQDESYLLKAKKQADNVLQHFENKNGPMLYFTNGKDRDLIIRSTETSDNVIPASNSQMANNLFLLGKYFGENSYTGKAKKMLDSVSEELKHYAPGYSNWGILSQQFHYPFYELAIVGKDVDEKLKEVHKHAYANTILAVSPKGSELPLTKGRLVEGMTLLYVCRNNTCKLPVDSVAEAMKQF